MNTVLYFFYNIIFINNEMYFFMILQDNYAGHEEDKYLLRFICKEL